MTDLYQLQRSIKTRKICTNLILANILLMILSALILSFALLAVCIVFHIVVYSIAKRADQMAAQLSVEIVDDVTHGRPVRAARLRSEGPSVETMAKWAAEEVFDEYERTRN